MKNSKVRLAFIIIAVIALAIVMSGYLTFVQQLSFAGFTWQDNEVFNSAGGGSFYVTKVGEFVEIKGATSETGGTRYIETDVTGIDELLIIYEGSGSATTRCDYGGAGFSIYSRIVGTSGEVTQEQGGNTPCNPQTQNTFSATFAPAIWKFKNNFDGTWSSMQSLNVGDIFIVKQTKAIGETPKLRIGVSGGAPQGSGGTANIYLKLYNVVRKENAFAVCKADKYAYDVDNDGKIATDGSECFDLKTIVLNSEEAIKESYDEKLARITAELEAKNAGLQADITSLQQQLANAQLTPQTYDDSALQQQIMQLQAELKEAKAVLANVQAREPVVINTIVQQEQFKKPNFLIQLWDNFIAWIKGLFS